MSGSIRIDADWLAVLVYCKNIIGLKKYSESRKVKLIRRILDGIDELGIDSLKKERQQIRKYYVKTNGLDMNIHCEAMLKNGDRNGRFAERMW